MVLSDQLIHRIKEIIADVFPPNLDYLSLFPKSAETTLHDTKEQVKKAASSKPVQYVLSVVSVLKDIPGAGLAAAQGLYTVGTNAYAVGAETIALALEVLNQEFGTNPRMFLTNMFVSSSSFALVPSYGLDIDRFQDALCEIAFQFESADIQKYKKLCIEKNQEKDTFTFSFNDLARVSNVAKDEIKKSGEIIKRELDQLFKQEVVSASNMPSLKEMFQNSDSEIQSCIGILKFIKHKKGGSDPECDIMIHLLQTRCDKLHEVYRKYRSCSLDFGMWHKNPPLDPGEKHIARLLQFVISTRADPAIVQSQYLLRNLETNAKMQLFSYSFYIFHFEVLVHCIKGLRQKVKDVSKNDSKVTTILTQIADVAGRQAKQLVKSVTGGDRDVKWDLLETKELDKERKEFLEWIPRDKSVQDMFEMDALMQTIDAEVKNIISDGTQETREQIKIQISELLKNHFLQPFLFDPMFLFWKDAAIKGEAGRTVVEFVRCIHDASRFLLLALHQWLPIYIHGIDPIIQAGFCFDFLWIDVFNIS